MIIRRFKEHFKKLSIDQIESKSSDVIKMFTDCPALSNNNGCASIEKLIEEQKPAKIQGITRAREENYNFNDGEHYYHHGEGEGEGRDSDSSAGGEGGEHGKEKVSAKILKSNWDKFDAFSETQFLKFKRLSNKTSLVCRYHNDMENFKKILSLIDKDSGHYSNRLTTKLLTLRLLEALSSAICSDDSVLEIYKMRKKEKVNNMGFATWADTEKHSEKNQVQKFFQTLSEEQRL